MVRERCTAIKANDERCRSWAVRDGLCQIHSLTPQQRLAQSSKGGRANRHNEVPVTFEMKRLIVQVVADVANGEWSAQECAAMLADTEIELEELRTILAGLEPRPAEREAAADVSWTGTPSPVELEALVAGASGAPADPHLHVAR
jgi:hypothetical protein